MRQFLISSETIVKGKIIADSESYNFWPSGSSGRHTSECWLQNDFILIESNKTWFKFHLCHKSIVNSSNINRPPVTN